MSRELQRYVERRRDHEEWFFRMLKDLYDGYAADPVPPDLSRLLDRMR